VRSLGPLSGVCLVAAALLPSCLSAATVSYTGTFSDDDQEQVFSFTLGAPGTVTLRTLGYAGGVNGNSTVILSGGFDPILSLFDATGSLIALNDDDLGAAVDPVTGNGFDASISGLLAADQYTLVLTEADNLPVGPTLADGFTRTGQGNFTGPEFAGIPGSFWDATPAQRNGNWAVDLVGVTVSTVPEPATLFTFGTSCFGLLSCVILSRRRMIRKRAF
jgi:hypothetical protein